ncbi:MAG: hypothetical protein Q9217_000575 [Psora testacea]
MAAIDNPPASLGPNSQVPLDTIPISPAKENDLPKPSEETTSSGAAKSGDDVVTVFHDKDSFNAKHPLMHEWTLWFTKPPSGKESLTSRCDYHLFKRGVRPEWEDPQNKHGGKWAYHFKDKRTAPIDELWLHVMLAAIGETLQKDETDGEVMGVVVNVRKSFYRIGLWTKTVGNAIPRGGDGDVAGGKGRSSEKSKEVLLGLGRKFKEVLKLKDSEVVEFSGHTESAHAGSSRAKAKYTC